MKLFSLGFGDLVPLASVQRSGESLYSRWGYFIFTVSFILFGLAIMASSLNLLVLRLARFQSDHTTSGVSALISRNEEELIAAAIAHHRASIHIQQRNRIYSTNSNLNHFQLSEPSFPIKHPPSWYSALSPSSSLSSSSSTTLSSKIDSTIHSKTNRCCSGYSLFNSRKHRKHHWHSRRSPQNIKHLIYFDNLLQNHKLTINRKSALPLQYHNYQHFSHLINRASRIQSQKQHQQQHRVSI